MKFSIVVPTYKRPALLKEALVNILNQTYINYEVLICSDGYDPADEAIVNEFDNRFKYYFIENKGKQFGHRQRNAMMLNLTGDFVLWVDDDNIIYPNYLEIASSKCLPNTGIVIHNIKHNEVGIIPKTNSITYYEIDTLNFIVKTSLAKTIKWDEQQYWADFTFIKTCENACKNLGLQIVYSNELIGEHRDMIREIPAGPNTSKVNHFYWDILGWFDFEDVYSMAIREAKSGAHFVEVGAWMGKSAAYMAVEIANSYKDIKFDVVDTWDGGEAHKDCEVIKRGELFKEFSNNIKSVQEYINPVAGTSVDVSKLYLDNSLDFVFLDAGHDYDSVHDDILAWFPKVKDGAILGGHDYNDFEGITRNNVGKGVRQAVDEIFKTVNVSKSSWWIKKGWNSLNVK